MKYLFVWLFMLIPTYHILAQISHSNETEYSDYIQYLIGGEREFNVPNGRVDLVTDRYAFEIERAENWKEAIGQCLWYALQTNLKPGIILIRETREEYKYFQMLNTTLEFSELHDTIKVLLFPDDFDALIKEKRVK